MHGGGCDIWGILGVLIIFCMCACHLMLHQVMHTLGYDVVMYMS